MEYKLTTPNPPDVNSLIPHQQFWKGQRDGVEQILQLWEDGVKVVMVNGPTGAGKSLVGIASAASYFHSREEPLDCTVLTQTLDLQEQYAREFKELCKEAKGRRNFFCGIAPARRGNECPNIGEDEGCSAMCPYRLQRVAAQESPVRAINYAFYGATGSLFHARVMVADEADYLGELLVRAKSVDLTRLVDEYGLQLEQGWVDDGLIQTIKDIATDSADPQEREDCKKAIALLSQKRYAVKGVGNTLTPQPEARVVQDFCKQPTLIMSATVFAPQYWSKEWNIPVGWVELPCSVPASKRPIKLLNVSKINKDTTESEWKKIIEALDNLIASRVESKGLIHSVSNWLTDMILKYSKYRYMMFKASGSERLSGINAFIKADKGILIGPQLLRGLNLTDDLCRWIVFPKVPYPSLEDARVKEMLKGGDERYLVETLGAIIQGAGRGIRHADDSCEILILDSSAGYLFSRCKSWMPAWFKEAIVYV